MILVALFLPGRDTLSQGRNEDICLETFPVRIENLYELKYFGLIPGTEKLYLNGRPLNAGQYMINYASSSFRLSENLKFSYKDSILISYRALKPQVSRIYRNRDMLIFDTRSDQAPGKKIYRAADLSSESIFGKGIQKSGTITRGFRVGTGRDFSLESGLRLEMSGTISDDIEIAASLSDANSPIQPEGTSERLEELDKVFVEIRHPNAAATFGDFDFGISQGEFAVLNKKLQGFKASYTDGTCGAFIALANSRGKFQNQKIDGQDGFQGPYRLLGSNGERSIIIVAGSEKIYLDGEEMKRGENRDYSIDYSNATLSFTTKRVITAQSRIYADFEYNDRNYERNFISGGGSKSFLKGALALSLSFSRESDNKDSPLDISLSKEDIVILKNAGSDVYKAVKPGESLAQPDSLGVIKGTYEKVDSLISGARKTIYRYNPGGANALYNLDFSYVGSPNGDYEKQSSGNFYFVGTGQGSYLPIKLLPLPEGRNLANLSLEGKPFKGASVVMDLAGTEYNPNLFASGVTQRGLAHNIKVGYKSASFDLSFRQRRTDSKFNPLGNINSIEFDRDYNTSSSGGAEMLREADLALRPYGWIQSDFSFGSLEQGSLFNSKRYKGNIKIQKGILGSVYTADYVHSSSSLSNSSWLKQSGQADLSIGRIRPGISFREEFRDEKSSGKDSSLSQSLRLFEISPFVGFASPSGFEAKASLSMRREDHPLLGVLQRESSSDIENLELKYSLNNNLRTELSLSLINKKYEESFRESGNSNMNKIMLKDQTRFDLINSFLTGDLYYEALTEKTSRFEKVFLRVAKSTGAYDYIGDLNKNGIADEFEFKPDNINGDFVLTTQPTEKLYPVIDLKTSARIYIDLSKIMHSQGSLESLISQLSSESSIRVEELSQETDIKRIYLLQKKYLLNDSTTIRGFRQIEQNFYIFKNQSALSIKLNYYEKKSLENYSSGLEAGYLRTRGWEFKLRISDDLLSQTNYSNKYDKMLSGTSSSRSRNISGNEFKESFTYMLSKDAEFSLSAKGSRQTDSYPVKPVDLSINGQSVKLSLSFTAKGRFSFEFEREELRSSDPNPVYEMTGSSLPGNNFYLKSSIEMRFGSNFQLSSQYDLRLQPSSKAVNNLRAEARAFF